MIRPSRGRWSHCHATLPMVSVPSTLNSPPATHTMPVRSGGTHVRSRSPVPCRDQCPDGQWLLGQPARDRSRRRRAPRERRDRSGRAGNGDGRADHRAPEGGRDRSRHRRRRQAESPRRRLRQGRGAGEGARQQPGRRDRWRQPDRPGQGDRDVGHQRRRRHRLADEAALRGRSPAPDRSSRPPPARAARSPASQSSPTPGACSR